MRRAVGRQKEQVLGMRLYVGNLPFKATEGDIQAFFEGSGFAVEQVSLMKDKFTGQPRGFGFVDIADGDQAEAAVRACNGKELMGRALVINEARPMSPAGGGGGRPPRGGHGGGYGRDRRGRDD
jgi:cold-inducible RNA-binding protein